jgi:hypothetical protein
MSMAPDIVCLNRAVAGPAVVAGVVPGAPVYFAQQRPQPVPVPGTQAFYATPPAVGQQPVYAYQQPQAAYGQPQQVRLALHRSCWQGRGTELRAGPALLSRPDAGLSAATAVSAATRLHRASSSGQRAVCRACQWRIFRAVKHRCICASGWGRFGQRHGPWTNPLVSDLPSASVSVEDVWHRQRCTTPTKVKEQCGNIMQVHILKLDIMH